MKKNFYQWHRRLGIAACLIVLVWSASGFLHPIMSWTQPRPVKMAYQGAPLAEADAAMTPAEAMRQNGINTFSNFAVVSFDGRHFYQIETERGAALAYLDAATGVRLDGGDEKFAAHLARYFTGEDSASVARLTRLTTFGGAYTMQNRYLPVYEVEFARPDRLRVYVETQPARVATLVDRRKALIQGVFTNLHNLGFAGLGEPFRSYLLMLFMLVTFCSAASGFVVYLLFWKHFRSETRGLSRNVLRKYHRSIGIAVALFVMASSLSGAFHAFAKRVPDDRHLYAASDRFAVEELRLSPFEAAARNSLAAHGFSVVRLFGAPFYRLTDKQNKAFYVDAATGAVDANGELKHARSLANGLSGLSDADVVSVRKVAEFAGEYGFINKRLPVIKVEYDRPGGLRYYVEPATGELAAKIEDRDLYEAYTFNYLHKWQFLNFIGPVPRDILLMTFVAFNMIVAALGLGLFITGRRKRGALD